MTKKKSNSPKKKIVVQHELQIEPRQDLNGSTTVIDSFILNRTVVVFFC